MLKSNQRVLTGTRSSGKPHLGNYFGAYKPAVDLQIKYELFFFIADFHALNEPYTAKEIHAQSLDLAATMLACGLNVQKSLFYAQSGVPEVCELAWMLACQMPYGMLLRAHSFKDAMAKGVEVNAGVFNYPVLMAADILLYDAALVPVGQDQKQHVEMARDVAQRFNNRYGEFFTVPEPLISEAVAIVPGTDGGKMSKSKGNVIPIFADDKEWKKAVMSIVTDSKGVAETKDPKSCNVFKLYELVAEPDAVKTMAEKYAAGGYGYGHAKLDLLEAIRARFSGMRDTYQELMHKRTDYLQDVIAEGSRKARAIAIHKLARTHELMGLIGGRHR